MKKTVLAIFAGWFLATAADTPKQATYVTSAEIQATLKKAAPDSATDQQVRMVDVGKTNVGVGAVYRSAKANQSAVAHDNITEVYVILEGAGTLTTGGEILGADGRPATAHDSSGPSGPSVRGTSMKGGESRKVVPGDVIIIPPGVSHVFSSIDGTIKYSVVRVDPDKVMPLK